MDAPNDTRLQLRRLLWWNRFFVSVLLMAALFAGAQWKLREMRELKVSWQPDGSVSLRAVSDGPFVVTHLTLPGDRQIGARASAALSRPLAVIDSGGASLAEAEVARLIWVDAHGQKMPAPAPGTPLSALYFEPKVAIGR